jgi:LysM repeat protein
VAQETTSPAPAAAPLAGKTYLVKAGDTVTRIASELGVTIPDLEKVNNLKGDSVLQVGQVLTVPEKPVVAQSVGNQPSQPMQTVTTNGVPAAAMAATPAVTADQGSFQEYTVVKGDNPYKLAKKFRVTPDELMKANGITDPKKIQIGQKLRVPQPTVKAKGK